MNKLNKLYEAMLKSWGCTFTDNYAIMLNMGGIEVPVKVDDKQVYMATSENLNGVTIGKVFFHPACESIMSKETEIFKVIRKLSSAKIFAVFQPMFEVILNVASKKSGKTLNGKTLEQLEPFKSVSKALKGEIIDIIKAISINLEDQSIDTRLINFSLIKGGKTDDDQTAYYTATPSFPFYTELYRVVSQNEHLKPSDRLSFNGSNVSMAALTTVIALFEMALPACMDPSRKKYSATSPDAARLTAYLHSYGLVVSDMNSLIGKFRKEFDAIGIYGIDVDWLSDLDEIGEIRNLIPALDYNNYNLAASTETPASNSRVSSINSLNGLFSASTGNQQQHMFGNQNQQSSQPRNTPPVPPTNPGESYAGCEYFEAQGIYEFRYNCNNGTQRVRKLAEDGRFISEEYQTPMLNGMGMMGNGMNMGMANNGMAMGLNPMQLLSTLMNQQQQNQMVPPLVGLGFNNGMAPNGFVRDAYSGQLMPAGQQQQQQQQGFTHSNNGSTTFGMGVDNGY